MIRSLLQALARAAGREAAKQAWKRLWARKSPEMPEHVKRDLKAQQEREAEYLRAVDQAKTRVYLRDPRKP